MVDWYAYADFAVHADTKSHTGGVLNMSKGAIQEILMNQNISTKSSTEVELVASNYVLLKILWARNFLK